MINLYYMGICLICKEKEGNNTQSLRVSEVEFSHDLYYTMTDRIINIGAYAQNQKTEGPEWRIP